MAHLVPGSCQLRLQLPDLRLLRVQGRALPRHLQDSRLVHVSQARRVGLRCLTHLCKHAQCPHAPKTFVNMSTLCEGRAARGTVLLTPCPSRMTSASKDASCPAARCRSATASAWADAREALRAWARLWLHRLRSAGVETRLAPQGTSPFEQCRKQGHVPAGMHRAGRPCSTVISPDPSPFEKRPHLG